MDPVGLAGFFIFVYPNQKAMKIFYLSLAFFLFFQDFSHAQSCLPEGITFTSQEQVDDFSINYPGCTSIEGYVKIQGPVTNLNGLSVLTLIGGDLNMLNNGTLQNFTGLENLESIGGGIIVANAFSMHLEEKSW